MRRRAQIEGENMLRDTTNPRTLSEKRGKSAAPGKKSKRDSSLRFAPFGMTAGGERYRGSLAAGVTSAGRRSS